MAIQMATSRRENRPTSFSVVIPALDEERAIESILERVLALRARLTEEGLSELEVIVVDDGSRDRTAEVAARFPQVRVLRHERNRGYGAALKTGLRAARGDLVAFLDADGTYPPESFPELLRTALAGADIVIGSRMSRGRNGMPVSRRIGNRIFAALVTLLGNQRVEDCASGMRVLRRDALRLLYPLPDGLNFTPIMSLRAMHEGLEVVEVPIPYAERVGDSKLSVVQDGLRYLYSIVWTALGYNPVRVLGAIGLGGVAVACLVGIVVAVLRLQGVTELGPWGVAAIFVALVLGVAGASLFSLGATFNYLVSLFRKQPVRVGLFRRPLFRQPLERHFGWLGLLVGGVGVSIAAVAITMGLYGWAIERLWLYLVGSALLILVGLQLVVSWILMSTLREITERDLGAESGPAVEDQ